MLYEIFRHLEDGILANVSLLNWTCKEVVERRTEWGERKRFLRMFNLLLIQGTVTNTPRPQDFPIERIRSDIANKNFSLFPQMAEILALRRDWTLGSFEVKLLEVKLRNRTLQVSLSSKY